MGYRVGIDIGGETVKGALIENGEKILYKEKTDILIPITIEEMETKIEGLINSVLEKSSVRDKEIECIGIGCTGIVDVKEKIVKYACNLDWNNVEFSDFLEKKHILLVQGSGFNMDDYNHFRIVFLADYNKLKFAMDSLEKYLNERKK